MSEHKNELDKNAFISLLQKAKGSRSQAQFARDCDISVSYMNRFFQGSVNTRPTHRTLKKIADHSADENVTYSDLLRAAGYLANVKDIDFLVYGINASSQGFVELKHSYPKFSNNTKTDAAALVVEYLNQQEKQYTISDAPEGSNAPYIALDAQGNISFVYFLINPTVTKVPSRVNSSDLYTLIGEILLLFPDKEEWIITDNIYYYGILKRVCSNPLFPLKLTVFLIDFSDDSVKEVISSKKE